MDFERLVAIGLDAGTGGVRALAIDLTGRVVAAGRADFPADSNRSEGVFAEQDPQAWTAAAQAALRSMAASAAGRQQDRRHRGRRHLRHLPAGRCREPPPGAGNHVQRPAGTAAGAAGRRGPARARLQPYGIEIAAAFALPKILHLAATQPEIFGRCRRIVHQTDWIVGMLCGRYDVTDISTALKTGADPGTLAWPEADRARPGASPRIFPERRPARHADRRGHGRPRRRRRACPPARPSWPAARTGPPAAWPPGPPPPAT